MASDILIHLLILLISVAGALYALWPSGRASVILVGKVEISPFANTQPNLVIQQGYLRKEVRLLTTGSFRVRVVRGCSMRIHVVAAGVTKQTYHISHQSEYLAMSAKAVPVFDIGVIGTPENLNDDRICQVQCGPGGTLAVRAGHSLDERVPRDRRLLDHSARMLGRPDLHSNESLTIASKAINCAIYPFSMALIFTYRTILTILIFFIGFRAQAQNVGINTTGSAPNAYALFDADNNGLLLGALFPRLSTASRLAMAGLSGTEDGLVVYDITTKSFWYWDGTQWVEVGAGSGSGGWQLSGNSGTVDGTHFLGTLDNIPLSFRVNNEQAGRIEFGLWANTFFGHGSGLNNTGSGNTAIGARALGTGNTGSLNTALGISALGSNTTGEYNSASGNSALFNNNTGSYNTAQGHVALLANTTGDGNTAQGSFALVDNTSGTENTAMGQWALRSNVAGSNGTAIGARAMQFANNTTTPYDNTNLAVGYEALMGSLNPANNTGLGNTGVGFRTLLNNSTGGENTALGLFSLTGNSTGGGNTAMGAYALNANSTGNYNTAIGHSSLVLNTTGGANTAIGEQSMVQNLTGSLNAGIGRGALYENTSGNYNTAIGPWAMRENTTANENTAVGAFALHSNTISEGNTALGYRALYTNDGIGPFSGTDNTALGYRAMESNTTGAVNTAIGSRSMSSNSTGSYNVAMGWLALDMNTSGSSNTAIGSIALTINTTGGDNTGVGRQTLFQNTTGSYNAALGSESLSLNGTGSSNTALGYNALIVNTSGEANVGVGRSTNRWNYTGSNNTMVGSYAGHGGVPHSKSGCVFLGYRAGYFELVSNRLYIDNTDSPTPLIYGEFDNDFVTINQNLGIGIREFGGGSRILSIGIATPPAAPITGGGMLFAQDVGGTAELRVMDGAGNVTTISPHNFSLTHRSEPMAWAFYSENASLGQRVNVDMMRVVRLVEHMSGELLVNLSDLSGGQIDSNMIHEPSLEGRISQLEVALEAALVRLEELQQLVATQETLQTKP